MTESPSFLPRDPDRDTLVAFLTEHAAALGLEDPTTDIEIAAYWIAAHFHAGQWSDLYAALCASPYRPGPFASEIVGNDADADEDYAASILYAEAAAALTAGAATHE